MLRTRHTRPSLHKFHLPSLLQHPSTTKTTIITMSPSTAVLNKKALTPSMQSPERVYFRKNALVPATPTGGSDLGRETLYEPVLVCSPVLASQRVHLDSHQEKKRLITADEVSELTKQLNAMLHIVDQTPTVQRTTVQAVPLDSTAGETAVKTDKGRYDGKLFSPKAKGEVDVKRSFRLVGRGPE
jgi:hypothetical protein